MIPSLTRDASFVRRVPEWPAWPPPQGRSTTSLFEERPALRKLVVVADADLLATADDSALSRKIILTGLLTHPYIKLLRYRDDGPPADASRQPDHPPEAGLSAAKGWAELLPPDRSGSWAAQYVDGTSIHNTVVYGNGVAHARSQTGSRAYRDRGPEAAADQRERDILAAEVAQAAEADLYITERPYLFELPRPVVQGVTLCRTADALAIVALYLRSQHEFKLWCAANGTGVNANEWLWYQIGAVGLLPELWRWSAALAQVMSEQDKRALNGLHDALLQRIVRTLRTRDRFHRAYSLPQHRDVVRTVLVELDTLLVTLMGTADASARFVHILLELPARMRRRAGWHNVDWLKELAEKDASLASLFDPGTPLAHVLRILVRLRNTVHGEVIRATMWQQGSSRDAAIKLPAEDERDILDSMDAVGGHGVWGVRAALDRSLVVDAARFIEELFPHVLALLNTVMEHTPGTDDHHQRPTPGRDHLWYNERNSLSIRWQLGL